MAVDKQAPRPSEGAEESTGQWLTISHAGVEEESGLPEGPGWSWLCPAHVRVRNCIMEPPNQTIEGEGGEGRPSMAASTKEEASWLLLPLHRVGDA